MQLVLAIDVGTTSLKGMLFDSNGQPLAACMEEYDLVKPAPDVVELNCEVYWDAACKVIRTIIEGGNVDPRQIAAVGITSQGETLTVLGKSGEPLRRSIVWLDNRSRREAEEIGRQFTIDEVYRATGQPEIIATWSATRILWLRRHEPQVFRKARKFVLVADYLIYKLTGRFVTDRGLNPSTLYYDLRSGDWCTQMLPFLGITAEQLPQLADSGEVVGSVLSRAAKDTGLSTETVVTTAPIDQVAGAVGAGNLAPGVITETTGAAMAICASIGGLTYDPQKRVGL